MPLRKVLKPTKLVTKLLPFTSWCRNYDAETAASDLVAGLTIALTLVPQAIAYASLAGLDPQYGLYASLMCWIYSLFGTVAQINIGPTALLSLLTFSYCHDYGVHYAVLLCFVTGVVQLLAGVLQLGFLVNYISAPVVSGFTSAAALTIASSQIKGLIGLKFNADTFLETWKGLFQHITEIKMSDSILSVGCIVIIIALQKLKEIKFGDKNIKKTKTLQKIFWFIGVGRNAFVVVMAACLAGLLDDKLSGLNPFQVTGQITAGLPSPVIPFLWTESGNRTETIGEMLMNLGPALGVVPLIGIIANIAIAKAFADGKQIDATQEIIALGICNLVGSFFRSFPVNGSFSRSAVSQASGVKTPGSGLYTGAIIMITLAFLTPYFYYIPKSALSSVIICAVIQMVEIKILFKIWHTNKVDLIPLLATFFCCLFVGIAYGILCGVIVDSLLINFHLSKVGFKVRRNEQGPLPPHCSLRLPMTLHFTSAGNMRNDLSNYPGLPMVLYCDDVRVIDYTSLENIKTSTAGHKVLVVNANAKVLEFFQNCFGNGLIVVNENRENTSAAIAEALQRESGTQELQIKTEIGTKNSHGTN